MKPLTPTQYAAACALADRNPPIRCLRNPRPLPVSLWARFRRWLAQFQTWAVEAEYLDGEG